MHLVTVRKKTSQKTKCIWQKRTSYSAHSLSQFLLQSKVKIRFCLVMDRISFTGLLQFHLLANAHPSSLLLLQIKKSHFSSLNNPCDFACLFKVYCTMMMRVLGLLISSSQSRGRISCDNSSCRRLQICGQFLCTTERKA